MAVQLELGLIGSVMRPLRARWVCGYFPLLRPALREGLRSATSCLYVKVYHHLRGSILTAIHQMYDGDPPVANRCPTRGGV